MFNPFSICSHGNFIPKQFLRIRISHRSSSILPGKLNVADHVTVEKLSKKNELTDEKNDASCLEPCLKEFGEISPETEDIDLVPPRVKLYQDLRVVYSSVLGKERMPVSFRADLRDKYIEGARKRRTQQAVEKIVADEIIKNSTKLSTNNKDLLAVDDVELISAGNSATTLPNVVNTSVCDSNIPKFPDAKGNCTLTEYDSQSLQLYDKHAIKYESLPKFNEKDQILKLLHAFEAGKLAKVSIKNHRLKKWTSGKFSDSTTTSSIISSSQQNIDNKTSFGSSSATKGE